MPLFFIVFFSLYGGMHFYFFMRARAAFALHPAASFALAGFLLLMTLAPVLVRTLERREFEESAHLAAWPGYSWLGLLFLFCSLAVPLDLYRLAVRAAAHLSKYDLAPFLLSGRSLFLAASAGAFAVSVYGFFAARDIRPEQVTIASPRIPASAGRIRIVQISDLHLGLIIREGRLARVAALVREADPDLLVSTGDFVDGHLDGAAEMLGLLRDIRPRLGKFAVTGNHEYYVGLDRALRFTRDAGFTVLRGEAAPAGDLLTVAGVDDPAGNRSGQNRPVSEGALLRPLPRDRFTLFLKHQPRIDRESAGLFDLQLSGHVHKGQIFPFSLLTRLAYPISTGLSRLPGGGSVYVSRGTGTWGPPIRFLAPPEVTVIDLVHG